MKLIVYTSILHADTTPLMLAEEHRDTEAALRESAVPFVLLRNGWYTEVYTWRLPATLARGVLAGAAGDGRISAAARADYARAAATMLTGEDHSGRIYELAGDASFTLADLAAVVREGSGKPMAYQDMSREAFRSTVVQAGPPETLATIVSDTDAGMARGAYSKTAARLPASSVTRLRRSGKRSRSSFARARDANWRALIILLGSERGASRARKRSKAPLVVRARRSSVFDERLERLAARTKCSRASAATSHMPGADLGPSSFAPGRFVNLAPELAGPLPFAETEFVQCLVKLSLQVGASINPVFDLSPVE